MPKMLILRGKSGTYPGEDGTDKSYPDGALHEGAATDYAARRNYTAQVLQVAGLATENSQQTNMAVTEFRANSDITAFYGFSAGGYNVKHILDELTPEECSRIKLVVVLGAPGNPLAAYQSSKYGDENFTAKWELVYRTDPPRSAPFVPKKAKSSHMFGPEGLLWELDNPKKT
jgi:hypothetical protein